MTLTELKYVIAVAREHHFGRAAETCFVSQPSLSVAIKKLEDELGVQLFERRASDIALTPVGKLVVDQAQRVIDESQIIYEIARQGMDPLSGPLRVGVIYTIAPYLIPGLISSLSDEAPNMPVYLEESFTDVLLDKLRTGKIDLAIMADTVSGTGFMCKDLYEEDFVLAVPNHHPWANRPFVSPSELKSQTMLLLGAGHCFRDQILGFCPDLARGSSGSGSEKTVEGSSLLTICHMVAQGLGITVLPSSSVPFHTGLTQHLTLIPLKDPCPSRRVILAWRKSFSRQAVIQAVENALTKVNLHGCRILSEPIHTI